MNKVDMVDDPELIELVELEVRELLTSYSSRATRSRDQGLGADGAGGQGAEAGHDGDPGADEGGGSSTSRSRASEGPAVPDADRGRVLDLGPRHGGDGRIERGIVKVGEEVEIVGIRDTRRRR
jgi:elongation factor Tu